VAPSLAGAVAILPGVVAGAEEVSCRFLGLRGDPDRRELVGSEEPRELAGVPAVGFDPLTGSAGGEGWGDDGAADPEVGQPAVQDVASRDAGRPPRRRERGR